MAPEVVRTAPPPRVSDAVGGLALIPARGGSARIPGKNVRAFAGRPMIVHSIEAALASGCFDRVIVSTDDRDIARIARAHGAEVPFVRPDALSDAHTGTAPVVAHAIDWLRQRGEGPDRVCCVYATAPFLSPDDLARGLEVLASCPDGYAFSATTYAFPIQRSFGIDADGRIAMFHPEHAGTRSQDLPEAWHDAGQFYWAHTRTWMTGGPVFTERSAAVALPRHRVQDIDTPEDWARAELMFAALAERDGQWRRSV